MAIAIQAELPPLRIEESGAIRVGTTRVLLEVVIHAFQTGATPEQIVEDYDSLQLADVYAVIAYYLRHCEAVEAYIAARSREADELRQKVESSQRDVPDIRKRLQASRETKAAS